MAWIDLPPDRPLRILAVVERYPPAYRAGGPIRSVHNLMRLLQAQTPHYLEVVCGDRDLGASEPLEGVPVDVPHDQDGIAVTYRSDVVGVVAGLRGSDDAPAGRPVPQQPVRCPSRCSPFARLAVGIRVVLAPRGMYGAHWPSTREEALHDGRSMGGRFRDVRWPPHESGGQ